MMNSLGYHLYHFHFPFVRVDSSSISHQVALQTRLSQQEQVILALKFKLLQYEISSKNKTEEELDCMVEEHQRQVQQLRGELAMKNDVIHKQKQELTELSTELQTKSELEVSISLILRFTL